MGNGLWRSLVSALDWGSRGRRFKSGQPDSKAAGQGGCGKAPPAQAGGLVNVLSTGIVVSSAFVNPQDFVARMKPTVDVLNGLCAVIETASERHDLQPVKGSQGSREVEEEGPLRASTRGLWAEPVRSSHSIGDLTLTAATDFGRCYAQLFSGARAPVFGHLARSRTTLEASIVTMVEQYGHQLHRR
jgi:hypothetical protein